MYVVGLSSIQSSVGFEFHLFFFNYLILKLFFFFFFPRLNCVTWKDLSDNPTVTSFPDISKVLQMESVVTASRIVIVGHGSQTMSLTEKGLDWI